MTHNEERYLARHHKLSIQIQKQKHMINNHIKDNYNLDNHDNNNNNTSISKVVLSDEDYASIMNLSIGEFDEILLKGDQAKRLLVTANIRLVFYIAKKYKNQGLAYSDLIQEGMRGLIKAVEKYNPELGYRFTTYAGWWVRHAISRAIANNSRMVRIPVHIYPLMSSISKAYVYFKVVHDKIPSMSELSRYLRMPIKKVEQLIKCNRNVDSIDDSIYKGKPGMNMDKSIKVKDRLISTTIDPSLVSHTKLYLNDQLYSFLSLLTDKEAMIIKMRYGLYGYNGRAFTLDEVGAHFNISRESIRQIESKSLLKMRLNAIENNM